MFGDALLCFHLEGTEDEISMSPYGNQKPLHHPIDKKVGFIPRHVYTRQSRWYNYVRQKYGLPLDSRHLYTKTDWEFFAMAVSSQDVRHDILQSVARWINETSTNLALTDLHETEGDGGWPGPRFFARPVVGGHFAFLALEKACNGKAMKGLEFLNKKDPDENVPNHKPCDKIPICDKAPICDKVPACEGELECLDPAPSVDTLLEDKSDNGNDRQRETEDEYGDGDDEYEDGDDNEDEKEDISGEDDVFHQQDGSQLKMGFDQLPLIQDDD